MPFTVSHAVVAFAARRTPLPVAAVAVGSMAPDVVLFAPFLPSYAVTHSWVGVLTIDLAVALVVLALWWVLVRPAWTPVVPTALRIRLPHDWARRPRLRPVDVPLVVVACVLGSVTHVAWDAWTHPHGVVVGAVPALRSVVAGHPVYSLLQDVSSAGGLLALAVAAAVWWRRTGPRSDGADAADVARASRPAPGHAVGAESRPHGSRSVPARGTAAGGTTTRFVREAGVAPVAAVGVVLVVAVVTALRVLLAGGGAGAVVVAEAFRLPATVAVVLVVGAVLLSVRADRTGPSGQTDRQERGEVGA